MSYYCDARHLICVPYSVPALHAMAADLGIKRCWFHNTPGKPHYDMPKTRVAEIQAKCTVVSSKDIVRLIQEHTV